jgi:hypothetical protein
VNNDSVLINTQSNSIMAALLGQYTEIPGESSSQTESNSEGESKNVTKIIYAAIGLVVIVIIFFLFFSGNGHKAAKDSSGDLESNSNENGLAGNTAENNVSSKTETDSACNSPKNCFDNPGVCKCNPDEYCSDEIKQCKVAVCGNGKCEPNEYVDTCCEDCGCVDNSCQVCNSSAHSCDAAQSKVSDEPAIDAVESYLEGKGLVAENIYVEYSVCSGSKILKYVLAKTSDSKITEEFSVSESMVVVPSPRI